MTLQGILIFLLCLNIKNIPPLLEKIVLFLSPLTLGVYLFHVHPLVFRRILPSINFLIDGKELSMFAIIIFIVTFLLFFAGAIFEFIRRILIDKILKITNVLMKQ